MREHDVSTPRLLAITAWAVMDLLVRRLTGGRP